MCLYVFAFGGVSTGFAALAIGLFNSIMFPVIFTLTLARSSASEEATSGLLCTAIVGSAFLPLLVGAVADKTGYVAAFAVPACYLVLCLFAFRPATESAREGTRKFPKFPIRRAGFPLAPTRAQPHDRMERQAHLPAGEDLRSKVGARVEHP